ncbi:hypothetical protein D1872_234130 [compost metagenome]
MSNLGIRRNFKEVYYLNELLLFLAMITALVLMFKVFFGPFNRKNLISALGILALIGIWVTFFHD